MRLDAWLHPEGSAAKRRGAAAAQRPYLATANPKSSLDIVLELHYLLNVYLEHLQMDWLAESVIP